MKMKSLIILACISAAQTAHATSIIINISDLDSNGTFIGSHFDEVFAPGTVTGTLTSVSIDVTLTASVNETYASDLTFYIDDTTLSTGGLLQIGGYNDLSATDSWYDWANAGVSVGNSYIVGTKAIITVNLDRPVVFSPTSNANMAIYIGNAFMEPTAQGTWTGTMTLQGLTRVQAVPEPGSLLLGMSGLLALAFLRTRRG